MLTNPLSYYRLSATLKSIWHTMTSYDRRSYFSPLATRFSLSQDWC